MTDMASSAVLEWQTVAAQRLDQLEAVHTQATGKAPGRRWQTTQLNRSLIVALVAQFQGFCRDLHDCAIDVHVNAAVPGQDAILRVLLAQGRKLDVGNPRKSALGADFGRFGISFIDALKTADAAAGDQLDDLDALVDFRSAIAHGNESEIAAIEAAGRVRATKAQFKRNRKALGALAVTMDDVVADHLGATLGTSRPW